MPNQCRPAAALAAALLAFPAPAARAQARDDATLPRELVEVLLAGFSAGRTQVVAGRLPAGSPPTSCRPARRYSAGEVAAAGWSRAR